MELKTNYQKNRYLCSYFGIHWHEWKARPYPGNPMWECSCGKTSDTQSNPNFCSLNGRIQLLRKMKKYWQIGYEMEIETLEDYLTEEAKEGEAGKLVDSCLEFLGRREK